MVGNEESFLCLCYVEPFWWWGISLNWVVVELEFWRYICFFRNLKPSRLEGFRALKPRQIEVFREPMPNFTPFLPKISPFCLLLAHLNKKTHMVMSQPDARYRSEEIVPFLLIFMLSSVRFWIINQVPSRLRTVCMSANMDKSFELQAWAICSDSNLKSGLKISNLRLNLNQIYKNQT